MTKLFRPDASASGAGPRPPARLGWAARLGVRALSIRSRITGRVFDGSIVTVGRQGRSAGQRLQATDDDQEIEHMLTRLLQHQRRTVRPHRWS